MPSQQGQQEPEGTTTVTVQCPNCWAVWLCYHMLDPNFATEGMLGSCLRCGREIDGMPACSRQVYRIADLPGFPSE